MTPRPAVFLDRDGVLNEVVVRDGQPESPRRSSEFRLVRDAASAVQRLVTAGLPALVVTNQPDLARGLLQQSELDAMMRALREAVPIDDYRVCPHNDSAGCPCRKPKPGLLLELAREWNVDLKRSFMVGDTWRDMAAGAAVGCGTVLLRSDYNGDVQSDAEADGLDAAVDLILAWPTPVRPESVHGR